MGLCCSKASGGQEEETVRVRGRDLNRRERQWQATGQIVLRDGGLKTLPPAVVHAGQTAKVLDLKGNKLVDLPRDIRALSQLHRLVLSNNQISSLTGISEVQNLKSLLLDNNKLTHLPQELGLLTKLESLTCSNNLLIELPNEIGSLRALKYLKCDSNQINELPKELGGCSQLVELDASQNDIKSIPEQIGQLRNLTCLALEANLLSSVPQAVLLNCTALHTIKLENNPITMEVFQSIEGYHAYEKRRVNKVNKQMAGGAQKNLDEGVTRYL